MNNIQSNSKEKCILDFGYFIYCSGLFSQIGKKNELSFRLTSKAASTNNALPSQLTLTALNTITKYYWKEDFLLRIQLPNDNS